MDNDCDGAADDVDEDGDGHLATECGGDDCDDGNPGVHGGAAEICDDGVDNDCDGEEDEPDECGDDDDADDDTGDADQPGEEPPESESGGCSCGIDSASARRSVGTTLVLLAALFELRLRRRFCRVAGVEPALKDRR